MRIAGASEAAGYPGLLLAAGRCHLTSLLTGNLHMPNFWPLGAQKWPFLY